MPKWAVGSRAKKVFIDQSFFKRLTKKRPLSKRNVLETAAFVGYKIYIMTKS
jgi:hypothetical protein